MMSLLYCSNCRVDIHEEVKNDDDNCKNCGNQIDKASNTVEFKLKPMFFILLIAMSILISIVDYIYCILFSSKICIKEWKQQLPFTVLSALISSTGIYVIIFIVYPLIINYYTGISAKKWSKIEGEILYSELSVKWNPGYPKGEYIYILQVLFTYLIDEIEYISNRRRFCLKDNIYELNEAKELFNRYSIGKKVRVYYNQNKFGYSRKFDKTNSYGPNGKIEANHLVNRRIGEAVLEQGFDDINQIRIVIYFFGIIGLLFMIIPFTILFVEYMITH